MAKEKKVADEVEGLKGEFHPASECVFDEAGKPIGRKLTLSRPHKVGALKFGPGESVIPLELYHAVAAREAAAPKNISVEVI